jgi:DNA-binding NarL/FixJ family response regulator
MGMGFTTCGGDHLARKSELSRTRRLLGAYRDLLVVEDEEIDAERLTATLHVLFGYETQIRRAVTLGDTLDRIQEQQPGIVFLDDILKPSVTASQSIPLLRGAGYTGPIVVVSGEVTHSRRSSLLSCGASDVIHKDDIDSVRVAEAISRLPLPSA